MFPHEVKFIGTSSGKVSLKRFHSSFLIKTEKYNLLVDAGDGISKAILIQHIGFNSIDGILISHLHADHYSGIPSLIAQMKMNERKKDLWIYVNKNLIVFIEELINKSYIFLERLGFKIHFIGFMNDDVVHINEKFNFLAKQNSHLNDYVKFDKQNRLDFSCSSFLFKINKCGLFYTGDIGSSKDLYLFKEFKIDYVISECTHVNFEEVILAFNQLKAKKLFLTHLSDEDEEQILKMKSDSTQEEKILFASDGLTFQF